MPWYDDIPNPFGFVNPANTTTNTPAATTSSSASEMVYNTATGQWGIMSSTGGFTPMPNMTGPYFGGPQVNIPVGRSEGGGQSTFGGTTNAGRGQVAFGGLPPLGAGIAGVNTKARKPGKATKASALKSKTVRSAHQ